MPLAILGLAVHFFLPQIGSLENSVNVIRSMSLWMVGLSIAAQVCSYLGSGYLIKAIVDVGKTRLSILRGALITLASTSIGLVAGGWLASAAATYRWVVKEEDNSEEAALAGVLPFLFNDALLIIVTILGLAILLIHHNLSSLQVATYSLFLSILGLVMVALIYGAQHQALVERLVLGSAARLASLLRRTFDPIGIQKVVDNIYISLALLRTRGWIRLALGSGLNIGFDMLTLYLLFIAAGHTVSPGLLVAGYGLAYLLGKVIFLFPGGVGIIESGMTAIYIGLGIPAAISVVVILSYRLFSFWIPTLLGFAVAGYLQRTA